MSEGESERAALAALLRLKGFGAPGLADALAQRPASELLTQRLRGGDDDDAQLRLLEADPALAAAELTDAAAAELAGWSRDGIRLVSIRDEDYPANLRLVHDRPAALLIAGDLGPAPAQTIAVVGTRRPSPRGRAEATRLAGELVAAGQIVVSGLAEGIDTAAHHAAIAASGRTIAVIGTGHGRVHPPANRALQARLADEHAVVSMLWPGTRPTADSFRRRNGLMSGLARATVIVEAGQYSGTRVQARLALAHGRPVCLMEPVLARAWAAELARRPGVHVVHSAAEVLAIAGRAFAGPPVGGPA